MAEKMNFDAERYQKEVNEPDFVAAQQAYDDSDYERAEQLWRQAYERGNVLAGVRLGILCYGKKHEEAIQWLTQAAQQGEIKAYDLMLLANTCYEAYDEPKAIEYLHQAEEKQKEAGEAADPLIHRQIADFYYRLSVDDEDETAETAEDWKRARAFDYYCKALAKGETEAAYDVGYMYFIEEYESEAFLWSEEELLAIMRKEAEAYGDISLLALLGDVYDLREEEAEAVKWYAKAWESGDLSVASRELADYYQAQDDPEQYFTVLSELGKEESWEVLEQLAECYEKGIGVEADSQKAQELKEESDLAYAREAEMEELLDAEAEAYD